MAKWICLSCSYVHDDENENVYEEEWKDLRDPGAKFECPLCGAAREFFVMMA